MVVEIARMGVVVGTGVKGVKSGVKRGEELPPL